MHVELVNWFSVFLRASALLLVFPIFSGSNFPVQLRVAIAALAAFLIMPTLPVPAMPGSLWGAFGLLLVETLVGLLIGFVSRMVYFALDLAGTFIGTEMGLALSADLDPFTTSQTQAPGLILYFLGAMILLSLDLHHWLLVAFQRSYEFVPVGAAHLPEALLVDVIQRSSKVFVLAVQLAAPMIAISFIVTLTLSVLGRAVPQVNVFAESFGLRTMAGLIVFGLTTTVMAQHIAAFLRHMPEDILVVVRLLGHA